jgi:hypothetical protein
MSTIPDPELTLLEATVLQAVARHHLTEKPQGDVVVEGAIDKLITAGHAHGEEHPQELYDVEQQIALMNLAPDG